MLKQIDRDLIELLAKKIALLKAEKQPETHNEEIADVSQLLAEMEVPEFVWKSITLNCVAASGVIKQPKTPVKSRRVTIIGGHGKMGRFFTVALQAAGHQVSILEHSDWDKAPQLITNAELVLICVNIEHTLSVVRQAAPYLSASTIVADITSFKSMIVPSILELHSGPVLSLHPMFGPGVQSFLSQNIIVCEGRHLEACQWFLDFMEKEGGKLTFCSLAEHDRMMTIVQVIRHFAMFGLGVFLAEENVNLEQSLNFASPLYRLQLDLIGRLFATDGSLSLKIMLSQWEGRQLIEKFAKTYSRLARLVNDEERTILEQEFESTRGFFQEQIERTLTESDHIIGSLSVFLAQKEVRGGLKPKKSLKIKQAA
ncbi:bifunctional chorismate mutase/prephenate dehydrogenase [Gloeothece verrucosa]|uniref:Chorismate mutase n=1 Tax=Gloeothece verrucosa (strain PCC 7822) TaxID=497965 RepID=E0UFY8_GLOV7|nr:bifunctional chorismate mutase/prephenate dehydrogenase [Gloeothece verrucosa]ADN14371.1 Chorismate mutase [Gloeothece verrucosa PCC 7822]